jgi:tRNA-2-methylthio-N6-dimethylallyladenosine synthase
MEYVKYNFGYMYSYSERPGTLAGRKMEDDVTETKSKKIAEIVDLQQNTAWFRSEFIGQTVEVLVEKFQKNQQNFQEEILNTVVFKRKL